MNATHCDVVVVGGSLAGSAAAAALARKGAHVVVVEKQSFPRHKVCGCFLSHEAKHVLERMGAGAALRAAGCEVIERFTLARPRGKRVEANLPAPVLSISRERLDDIVAQAARKTGALFHFEEKVLSLGGTLGTGFHVEGQSRSFSARVVLGAWGRFSPLDGKLERPFYRAKPAWIGFGKHLTGPSGHLAGRAVLHFFEGGYLGLSRVEGDDVNLAALARVGVARAAHEDFESLLDRLRRGSPALAEDLSGLRAVSGRVLVSEPVHLGFHGATAGDVLLVGDAAGVLDPFAGTGMSVALMTGEAAAAPILDFLAGRVDAGGLLESHRAVYRRVVGRRFFFSRLFRPFFASRFASRLVVPAAAPLAALAARLTRGRE